MAYRVRGRGQLTTPVSRSGKSFNYDGRRVLLKEGDFELNWHGPQVVQQVLDAVSEAFQNLSDDALAFMKRTVPVDSGDLRDSCFATIDISNNTISLTIGAGMPYAIYVELGTFKMEAQPYIRPTFDFIKRAIPGILRSEAARRAQHGNSLT